MTAEQMAAMNEVRARAKAEGRKLTMAEIEEHADAIAQWCEDYEPTEVMRPTRGAPQQQWTYIAPDGAETDLSCRVRDEGPPA